ncbi:uncharacterized protein LOC135928202 isoform X2 [Gordionus sp. m RMFG-2023]
MLVDSLPHVHEYYNTLPLTPNHKNLKNVYYQNYENSEIRSNSSHRNDSSPEYSVFNYDIPKTIGPNLDKDDVKRQNLNLRSVVMSPTLPSDDGPFAAHRSKYVNYAGKPNEQVQPHSYLGSVIHESSPNGIDYDIPFTKSKYSKHFNHSVPTSKKCKEGIKAIPFLGKSSSSLGYDYPNIKSRHQTRNTGNGEAVDQISQANNGNEKFDIVNSSINYDSLPTRKTNHKGTNGSIIYCSQNTHYDTTNIQSMPGTNDSEQIYHYLNHLCNSVEENGIDSSLFTDSKLKNNENGDAKSGVKRNAMPATLQYIDIQVVTDEINSNKICHKCPKSKPLQRNNIEEKTYKCDNMLENHAKNSLFEKVDDLNPIKRNNDMLEPKDTSKISNKIFKEKVSKSLLKKVYTRFKESLRQKPSQHDTGKSFRYNNAHLPAQPVPLSRIITQSPRKDDNHCPNKLKKSDNNKKFDPQPCPITKRKTVIKSKSGLNLRSRVSGLSISSLNPSRKSRFSKDDLEITSESSSHLNDFSSKAGINTKNQDIIERIMGRLSYQQIDFEKTEALKILSEQA